MKKILAMMALAAAVSAYAEPDGYFMAAVLDPGQLPTRTSTIYGGRVSLIYGTAQQLYGADLSVAGRTAGNVCGLQIGGLHLTDVNFYGAQIGIFGNRTEGNGYGFQYGTYNGTGGRMDGFSLGFLTFQDELAGASFACYQRAGTFEGLQFGGINVATAGDGVQLGVFNRSGVRFGKTKSIEVAIDPFRGTQIGLWNHAGNVEGFQFGLVNRAAGLYGVQIGLVNYIGDGGRHALLPFANWRF